MVTSIICASPWWRNHPSRMTLSTLPKQWGMLLNAAIVEHGETAMKKYVIERSVAGVGNNDRNGLSGIAHKSNEALAKLRPRIQWQESFVTADKTFCIYLAEDEAVIREHARL